MTKQLGIVLIVFGALLLIGSAFAYAYEKSSSYSLGFASIPITTNPFRDDTLPLIFGSVALFVAGFALMVYQYQNTESNKK